MDEHVLGAAAHVGDCLALHLFFKPRKIRGILDGIGSFEKRAVIVSPHIHDGEIADYFVESTGCGLDFWQFWHTILISQLYSIEKLLRIT